MDYSRLLDKNGMLNYSAYHSDIILRGDVVSERY